MLLQLGLNATGFKEQRLKLVLQVKAAEYSNLPKNGSSTSSKPKGSSKKLEVGSASAHDYDPLYIDSSGEEDPMEDIQSSASVSRPVGATALPVSPSDNVLTRCFHDLLKMRNQVSLKVVRSGPFLNSYQIATENGFVNPDDLVHERSIHHLSLLTVEGLFHTLRQ